MANINNSLGSFSGRIGDMVFCSGSKSRSPYVRSVSSKTKKPSPEQQATRLKFKMTSNVLTPFRSLIERCWKKKDGRKTAYEQAFGHVVSSGFQAGYPEIKLNFSQVRLSAGRLQSAATFVYERTGSKLEFLWTNHANDRLPVTTNSNYDEVIVALYSEELGLAAVYRDGVRRAHEFTSIEMDDAFSKGKLHAWLIFLSEDGKEASMSLYLGDGMNKNNLSSNS